MDKKKFVQDQILKLLRGLKREGMEDLINYLESSDFFSAPASTKYHGSFPGGLAAHSLHVYNALNFHYENLKDSDFGLPVIEPESIIIAGLLHNVDKINTYKETWKNEKIYIDTGSKSDAGGNFDWQVKPGYLRDPRLPMGQGAKSIFIIQQFIKLKPVEAQAIYWYPGFYNATGTDFSELNQTWKTNLLALLLYFADLTSIHVMENDNYSKN